MAILHYTGANNEEPTTDRQDCAKTKFKIINCPFGKSPSAHEECIGFDTRHAANHNNPPKWNTDSEEYFLYFALLRGPNVNGIQFAFPPVSALTQPNDLTNICDVNKCKDKTGCSYFYKLDIPYGKTIKMVWMNLCKGSDEAHLSML